MRARSQGIRFRLLDAGKDPMNEREYLVKAQEADAVANAAENRRDRHRWESIAKEYRRLAHAIAAERQVSYFDGNPERHVSAPSLDRSPCIPPIRE